MQWGFYRCATNLFTILSDLLRLIIMFGEEENKDDLFI